MDFNDTHEEAQFRARVRAFLDANATRREPGVVVGYRDGHDDPNALAKAKAWQRRKYEAGFAGITLSREWGGQGGTPMQHIIYEDEEAQYKVPRDFFEIGTSITVPVLGTWATQAQRERYIPKILSGEEVWCQLFSEPAAGSDLAGIRLRAERQGDEWVLNGQKIWNSGAHDADWGTIITRSDPTVPKHQGMTFFFLDMKSPGVEVRPIRQINGDANFNEVYFTDVRVPDSQRLGEVGQGWKVALTTLMNERVAAGQPWGPDVMDLIALARRVALEDGTRALDNVAVREKLADWYITSRGMHFCRARTLTALSRGVTPGPECSFAKLVNANKLQAMVSFAQDLLGQNGIIMDAGKTELGAIFQRAMFYSPAMRVAGGTDEILRNIVAERVLGLPADARADKDVPFNKIPTGSARG